MGRPGEFTNEVVIVVDERQIAFLLQMSLAVQCELVRRQCGVIEDIFTEDVVGVILENVLEGHPGGLVVLHLVVKFCVLECLPVKALVEFREHPVANLCIGSRRMVCKIFADLRDCGVGRSLVELIAQGRLVEAVDAQELGRLGERRAGISVKEVLEVGLGRVVVPLCIVAQSPVVLYRIVPLGAAGNDREALEQGCSL